VRRPNGDGEVSFEVGLTPWRGVPLEWGLALA